MHHFKTRMSGLSLIKHCDVYSVDPSHPPQIGEAWVRWTCLLPARIN